MISPPKLLRPIKRHYDHTNRGALCTFLQMLPIMTVSSIIELLIPMTSLAFKTSALRSISDGLSVINLQLCQKILLIIISLAIAF